MASQGNCCINTTLRKLKTMGWCEARNGALNTDKGNTDLIHTRSGNVAQINGVPFNTIQVFHINKFIFRLMLALR